MILKLKQNDSWRFIDNVKEVVTDNALPTNEVFIRYLYDGIYYTQDVSEGCYILNDAGKTIERVC